MTVLQNLQSAIELVLIIVVAYGIFKQETLIKIERKAWFYIKVFFKTVYFYSKEKIKGVK